MKLLSKLPVKITLLAVMFTMLGIILVGYVSLRDTEKRLWDQSFANINQQLQQNSSQFILHLNKLRLILTTLAEANTISQVLSSDHSVIHIDDEPPIAKDQYIASYFMIIMRHQPTYSQMRLIKLNQTNQPETAKLESGQKSRQESGQLIVQVNRKPNGQIVRVNHTSSQHNNTSYVRHARTLKEGQFYISDIAANPHESELPDLPTLHMVVPIFTDADTANGLLVVHMDFHNLSKQHFQQVGDLSILLTDPSGNHLYSSNNIEKITNIHGIRQQTIQQSFPSIVFFPTQTEAQPEPNNPQEPPPPQEAIHATTATKINLDSHNLGMVFQRIYFDPQDPKRFWLMSAIASNEAVALHAQQYWSNLLTISLIVLLGLSSLIVITVRQMTLPISRLIQTIHRIAAGEKNIKIPAAGKGEIGELSLAFQSMLTDLRYSNSALQDSTAHLEEQVRERTTDLAIARDQALAASKTKSSFLATMSHEIRTPMNVILGMLELLRTSDISLPDKERVELAFNSGNTLLTLINNILDFSKIEAQQITLNLVDFDLRHLVYEAAMTVAPLAHAKEIELTAFFPEVPLTAVRGDPIRLKQILINLVGNAIKFTSEGGSIEVHGGPTNSDASKIECLFEVRDSGIGVLMEDRETIFNQFTQADSSSTRLHEGSGLGLSICKHLVHMMNGEICVESNPYTPSGSVFWFTVELEKQQTSYPNEAKKRVFKDLRVLAVANDGLQRALIEDILLPRGAKLDHVTEAETTIEILQKADDTGKPYHLVLCNQKPGKNNRRELRQLFDLTENLRFILMTDLLDQGWDQATELPGTAICLKKPINSERLHAAIEWLITKQGSHQTIPEPTQTPEESNLCCAGSVLVVDDQTANLTVTKGMLISIGCRPEQIQTACNGQEAVTLFKQKPFDLVLMDCQMPVMDGFDATRAIKQWETEMGREPAPIIAFTADITPQSQENIRAVGMTGFLSKPVYMADLREQLTRYALLKPCDPSDKVSPQQQAKPGNTSAAASSSSSTQPKQIDIEELLKSMRSIGLQDEDFIEVANLLAVQFPELLGNMKRDFEQLDYQSARATAHVVKGSMANTIFPNLQKPTRILYEAVREQDWQQAQQELDHVTTLFTPIQLALLAFLEEKGETVEVE